MEDEIEHPSLKRKKNKLIFLPDSDYFNVQEAEESEDDYQNERYMIPLGGDSKQMDKQLEQTQKLSKKEENKNDPDRLVLDRGLEEFAIKIKDENSLFPAMSFITNEDKVVINNSHHILKFLSQPVSNREHSRKIFANMLEKVNEECMDDFQIMYSHSEKNEENCIKTYTSTIPFHNYLNKGLRLLRSPLQAPYFHLVFSDISNAVKKRYRESENQKLQCFRGTQIPEHQLQRLKNYKNGFIQLEGFISTSKILEKAVVFYKNVLFVIVVPERTEEIDQENDNGFADISKQSHFTGEEQILFNPSNIFQVSDYHHGPYKGSDKVENVVFLRYCRIGEIQKKKERTEEEQELLLNYEYRKSATKNITNQGYALFKCEEYENCIQWYKKYKNHINDLLYKNHEVKMQKECISMLKKYISRFGIPQVQALCKKYIIALYMIGASWNNLDEFEKAHECFNQSLYWQKQLIDRDYFYLLILKEISKVEFNKKQECTSLESFMEMLRISEEIKWEELQDQQYKLQIDVIDLMTDLLVCKKYKNQLCNILDANLKRIEGREGLQNQFYVVALTNKITIFYDSKSWTQTTQNDALFEKLSQNKPFVRRYKTCFSNMSFMLAIAFFQTGKGPLGVKKFEFYVNLLKESKIVDGQPIQQTIHMILTYNKFNKKQFGVFKHLCKILFELSAKIDQKFHIKNLEKLEERIKVISRDLHDYFKAFKKNICLN